jgi:2-oxoglutarate dehydrogenase E2 component (dihydrolipoamide succinyltransferase)
VATDVTIPELGESVNEATIVRWLKQDGDTVRADEPILEIETDKAAMEVTAEVGGRLSILQPAGARVVPGAVVGRVTEGAAAAAAKSPPPPALDAPGPPEPSQRDAAPPPPATPPAPLREPEGSAPKPQRRQPESREPPLRERPAAERPVEVADDGHGVPAPSEEVDVQRVPMTPLRRTIATRLVQAQRTAAILTTFNEVDLGELMALRARHRERFRAKHGVDLGYMSLFARAVVLALREVPILNASIDGEDIVHHRRVHLGIAVNTPRGLVVPVVRDADRRSLHDIERAVAALVDRARAGTLAPGDLAGGTFTITNGGVFGSLLSTPILNPPQSGILGMHKIEERPIAVKGQVVIRPMMYVALSYDHRLVDGAQAVTFLVRVKEQLEDPARMALEV